MPRVEQSLEGKAEAALNRWGQWARRGGDGLGWARATEVVKAMYGKAGHGERPWQPKGKDDDGDALNTDKLVSALPRELRSMLVLHYATHGETEEKIEALGIEAAAYGRVLNRARQAFRMVLE